MSETNKLPTTSHRVGVEIDKNGLTLAGKGTIKLEFLEDLAKSYPPGTTLAQLIEIAKSNSDPQSS